MNTTRTCPECGKPVPPNGLQGLCPECMMKVGLAAHTGEASLDDAQASSPQPKPPPALVEVAQLFPQLEILECLGCGGMGAVYKARQPRLDRLVALKILTRDREDATRDARFAERFEREARALAKLSHPNIVAMYEFGQAAGLPYFIMEYVDGLNLRQLEQAGKLAPREALQIIPQICEALQFAHDEGIVHRDIKPENILLDKKGRVKIADFGIAKILGRENKTSTLTQDQQIIGTPHYMAPEQVEKPQTVDHRADIFSLGVVFYEMLTGELPLGKFAPPSRLVRIDVRLDDVVLHSLEKKPERRYQQASEVKTDVESIANEPPRVSPSVVSEELPRELAIHVRRRQRMLWYGFIVSLIGLPVGIVMKLPYVWGLSTCGIILGALWLDLFDRWLKNDRATDLTASVGVHPSTGKDEALPGEGQAAARQMFPSQNRPHDGSSGRYQFGLLPNLQSGERVVHFQKWIRATLWKSPPIYRFFFSLPPMGEVGLYVTDRRVIVVSHTFRLITHEFSLWFPATAPGPVCEALQRVTTGQSRWFGPYLELTSVHPEKRWYRSRELRLRLYTREAESLRKTIVSASTTRDLLPRFQRISQVKTDVEPMTHTLASVSVGPLQTHAIKQVTSLALDDAVPQPVLRRPSWWAWLAGVAVCALLALVFFLAPPTRVTVAGRVTDNAGHALPDVTVRAIPLPFSLPWSDDPKPPKDKREFTSVTDSEGRYRLEGLSAKPYRMADTPSYAQEYDLEVHVGPFAPQRIRVSIGKGNLHEIDFVLEPEAVLSGRAIDTEGTPLAHQSIRLLPQEQPKGGHGVRQNVLPQSEETDGLGAFRFEQVPPGAYVLEIPAYADRGFEVPQRSTNSMLRIRSGEKVGPSDFFFESQKIRGGVSGRVVNAESGDSIEVFSVKVVYLDAAGPGWPVFGCVRNDGAGGAHSAARATSWKHGSFLIEGMSPGLATLEISAEGSAREKARISVRSAQTTNITIALKREGILRGRASRNGKPCGHGYVNLRLAGEAPEAGINIQTDSRGFYEYRGLPAGEYVVRICIWLREDSFSAQLTDLTQVRVEAGQDTRADLEFGRSAGLQGKFNAPDKTLPWVVTVEDASPAAASLPPQDRLRATAWKLERTGRYSIEGLAPGTYTVTAKCLQNDETRTIVLQKSKTVSVKDRERAQVDFNLP